MPIVVGTDSYISVADAQAYATRVGAAFAGTDPALEAALVRATAWIDATYRGRFPGKRTEGRAQALEWPRKDATDAQGNDLSSEEVPAEIESATAEAAIRELASPGSLAPDVVPGQTSILVAVEGIQWKASGQGGVDAQRPVVAVIDGILGSLIGAGTNRLLRA